MRKSGGLASPLVVPRANDENRMIGENPGQTIRDGKAAAEAECNTRFGGSLGLSMRIRQSGFDELCRQPIQIPLDAFTSLVPDPATRG